MALIQLANLTLGCGDAAAARGLADLLVEAARAESFELGSGAENPWLTSMAARARARESGRGHAPVQRGSLTPTQERVVACASEGLTNAQIAELAGAATRRSVERSGR